MIAAGELHVWRVRLNRGKASAPLPEEAERAARLVTPALRRRYLRAHAALRDILGRVAPQPLSFALHENGKPYLASAPEIRFNLSHSREVALIAVTRGVEVGVDIERIRPISDIAAIAARYFPPGHRSPANGREFFRDWTRFEALLKGHGVGLYGAGAAPPGHWTVTDLEVGPNWAAAVAVSGPLLGVQFHEYDGS